MKALIPAAGLGSRFLPATKAQPKEMLLVVDRPAIQYVVEEGLASAADEVIIINSRDKNLSRSTLLQILPLKQISVVAVRINMLIRLHMRAI